ncbi:MAG: iron chelate uptake ABC transporter family permease subunit, partial [Planctomycetota bacterium]
MIRESTKQRILILLFLLIAIVVVAGAPFFGTHDIAFKAVLRPVESDTDARIFWEIRVPRVLAAFLVGSALAVSGMAFQAMFRNPLATPFTLGVSSGASFGAALFFRLGLGFSVLGFSGVSLFAFLGAILSVLLVYGL